MSYAPSFTSPRSDIWFGPATVLENVQIARDTFRVRLACDAIAQRVRPGQFVMLKLAGCDDPLLGRPLALYDTIDDAAGKPTAIDLVYLVLGRMTRRLAAIAPGQNLELWGPLGNGFAPIVEKHLVMVAGGIGQTPFLAMAKQYLGLRQYAGCQPPAATKQVTFCYGVRSRDYLAAADFEATGARVRISSDDGSAGHRGLVTDLLKRTLDESADPCEIVCCGPEPMMHAVAEIAAAAKVRCQVSLETPMACGLGICFSCVARVRDGQGGWDYRRTCVEGPVFDAQMIEF